MNKFAISSLALALALPVTAFAAGGHYPVDDVYVGEPGDFIIESFFTRFDGDNSELGFLPTWRPGQAPLELVAGLIRVEEDGESINRFEPQLKYQLAPMEAGRWGSAVYLHAGIEDSDFNDLLLNFPFSYEFRDAPVAIHANIGWIHDRGGDENVDRVFLGGAFEWGFADSVDLIGQVYREGADEEIESQLGLRFHFDSPVEYIDLAVGRVLSGDDKDWFATVGFGLAF
ncbi:MAG: hypothetical protein ACXIUB_07825 [Wenzhouxiangella sp.]